MSVEYKMLSKEVAPGDIRVAEMCGGGSCPAVLHRSDGKFVIVGKALSSNERTNLEATDLVKVYADESVIAVDPELLVKALSQR